MPIVPCMPEDPTDPPFELSVDPVTEIGTKIRDGGYVVIGRKLWETEQGELHIESLMVRKVPDPQLGFRRQAGSAPSPSWVVGRWFGYDTAMTMPPEPEPNPDPGPTSDPIVPDQPPPTPYDPQ